MTQTENLQALMSFTSQRKVVVREKSRHRRMMKEKVVRRQTYILTNLTIDGKERNILEKENDTHYNLTGDKRTEIIEK